MPQLFDVKILNIKCHFIKELVMFSRQTRVLAGNILGEGYVSVQNT